MLQKLICILGESSTGKDTLVKKMVAINPKKYSPVMSYTNRPMRPSEEEGREHYFLTDIEFKMKKEMSEGNIAAYTKIGDYEYMATLNELHNKLFYIIDPNGYKNLKENVSGRYDISTIYITSSYETRKKRALKRGDKLEDFEKRYNAEKEQFREFVENEEYDYIIQNEKDGMIMSFFKFQGIVNDILSK